MALHQLRVDIRLSPHYGGNGGIKRVDSFILQAVGGCDDPRKYDMFVELTGAELDELFNGLATIEEFHITLNLEEHDAAGDRG